MQGQKRRGYQFDMQTYECVPNLCHITDWTFYGHPITMEMRMRALVCFEVNTKNYLITGAFFSKWADIIFTLRKATYYISCIYGYGGWDARKKNKKMAGVSYVIDIVL